MHLRCSLQVATLAACFLLAPVASFAQTPATPTTKIEPSKSLDAMLSNLEKDLVPLAEAMPAEKYNFSPSVDLFKPGLTPDYKGVRTFAQEIAHLAQANYFLFRGTQGIGKPDSAFQAKMAEIDKLTSKDELVKTLKESFAYSHTAIATLTPANAWDHAGRGPDDTRAQQAGYAVAHARDHYGQLIEYLRMNGIVPPASQGKPLANPPKAS